MPETLSSPAPPRLRYRALLAAVALVGALFATSAPLSAAADPIGSISGTVTDAAGQPVVGALVNISISAGQSTSFSETVWTDTDGTYGFTGLEPATYGLNAYAAGHQPSVWQYITVTPEAPSITAAIVLEPFATGTGSISGTVTADGVPLAGLEVTANGSFTGQYVSAITDEFGHYEITGLPNGLWLISAFAGFQYQYLSNPNVTLSDAAPTATADLAFVSWPVGTASISGVVSDSATAAPIAGVSVYAYGVTVPHNSSATSDEAGAFSFTLLPAGTYSLNITGFTTGYLSLVTEVTVLDGEAVTTNPSLVAANSTITGHVKDKNGLPIAGVYVDALTDGSSSGAVTDENGNYEITDVGAVAYTITVGGVGTPYTQKSKVVTPVANGSATANFTLKPRTTGSLSGWILVSETEVYNQPVCVTLYSSKNKKVIAETVTLGPDFGDGTYSFYDVKPGSYTVSFADCDDDPAVAFDTVFFGGATKYKDATFITVAAAEDSYGNDHTIDFRTATSTISGHVQKGNGTPLAGLTVTATDGGSTIATAVTDANGDYTITGLYTDRYLVSVGGPGTLYNAKQKNVNTVDDGDITVNFSLAKSH